MRVLIALTAVGSLTACWSSHDTPGDPAAWYVVPRQSLRPDATAFLVTVTRTGCSSGEQGKPLTPVTTMSKDAITITFRIDPHISDGTCQETPGVDYLVHLGEQIGNRTLVDGSCESVEGLASTGFCSQGGVRGRWRHGQLRLPGSG
jgi:hypothetical protein